MKSPMHLIRKFYRSVSLEPFDNEKQGYYVKLDNNKVKTQELRPLVIKSLELASMVKFEFLSQQEYIIQSTMPIVS